MCSVTRATVFEQGATRMGSVTSPNRALRSATHTKQSRGEWQSFILARSFFYCRSSGAVSTWRASRFKTECASSALVGMCCVCVVCVCVPGINSARGMH